MSKRWKCFLIGQLLMTLGFGALFHSQTQVAQKILAHPGTVQGRVQGLHRYLESWRRFVDYQYSLRGKTYDGVAQSDELRAGDKVTVQYAQDDPATSLVGDPAQVYAEARSNCLRGFGIGALVLTVALAVARF